ncbi:GntR family transcriptional regulator [Desulfobacula sp.]|uniref:GntR family transcriptional regulator n=1 Tax=Desulfobacula sp. TaxID=2593537 RepID=UPI0026236D17|nr:GntR family transcriptional regulator [Desulfobacula sp.]
MNNFKKETYSDQVVDYVKESILSGDLVPGAPITEVAIASELSISRAPIREAMQILIREGLIESHPQRGKNVTALTAKQIKNSYFTGGVLEAAAVAKVLDNYTDKDIAELEHIIAKMNNIAINNGSVSDQAPLDKAFHDLLFSRIDNALLVELCRRACQGISKFLLYKHWVKLFTAKKVYERHKEIVDALKTKNFQIIERVIREHYMESGERMSAFGVDIYEE